MQHTWYLAHPSDVTRSYKKYQLMVIIFCCVHQSTNNGFILSQSVMSWLLVLLKCWVGNGYSEYSFEEVSVKWLMVTIIHIVTVYWLIFKVINSNESSFLYLGYRFIIINNTELSANNNNNLRTQTYVQLLQSVGQTAAPHVNTGSWKEREVAPRETTLKKLKLKIKKKNV